MICDCRFVLIWLWLFPGASGLCSLSHLLMSFLSMLLTWSVIVDLFWSDCDCFLVLLAFVRYLISWWVSCLCCWHDLWLQICSALTVIVSWCFWPLFAISSPDEFLVYVVDMICDCRFVLIWLWLFPGASGLCSLSHLLMSFLSMLTWSVIVDLFWSDCDCLLVLLAFVRYLISWWVFCLCWHGRWL